MNKDTIRMRIKARKSLLNEMERIQAAQRVLIRLP